MVLYAVSLYIDIQRGLFGAENVGNVTPDIGFGNVWTDIFCIWISINLYKNTEILSCIGSDNDAISYQPATIYHWWESAQLNLCHMLWIWYTQSPRVR